MTDNVQERPNDGKLTGADLRRIEEERKEKLRQEKQQVSL